MATPNVIILAIDGGGIRGIIPAYILQQLEQQVGKGCYQLFDLIAGTSTGGIISLALTTPNPNAADPASNEPFSGSDLVGIYQNDGASIFVAQGCEIELCATYYGDDGDGNGVEPYLQKTIGASMTLSTAKEQITSLTGARVQEVFTTGYVVSQTGQATPNPVQGQDFGPYLFSWHASAKPEHDYCVWEAARGTSAAPVYFPIAGLGNGNGAYRSSAQSRWVVDGGTMANNPAMWAITQAFRLGLATTLSDITLISIGTGVYYGDSGVGIHNNAGDLVPDDGNWSEIPWLGPDMYDLAGNLTDGLLINVILSAVQQVTGAQLNSMRQAGLTYFRLEPSVPPGEYAMDDVSSGNVQNLLELATSFIAPATDDDPAGPGYPTFQAIVDFLTSANQ